MPPRPRSAPATRAAILAAARERFGGEGYERTTLRAVAADVGVDPAMVIRYFGSKEALFAAAADLDLHLPDLAGRPADDVVDALLQRFFAVWEDDATFLALMRASVTSPTAADTMRDVFVAQVAPALGAATPDHPVERAALAGSLVLGLALQRYVLGVPVLVAMSRDELVAWLGPLLRQALTGPAPGDATAQPSRSGSTVGDIA